MLLCLFTSLYGGRKIRELCYPRWFGRIALPCIRIFFLGSSPSPSSLSYSTWTTKR